MEHGMLGYQRLLEENGLLRIEAGSEQSMTISRLCMRMFEVSA